MFKNVFIFLLFIASFLIAIEVPSTIENNCLVRLQTYEQHLKKGYEQTTPIIGGVQGLWENLNSLKIQEGMTKLKENFRNFDPKVGIPKKPNGTFFGFVHFRECLDNDKLINCNNLKDNELISCLSHQRKAVEAAPFVKNWVNISKAVMQELDGVETALDFGSGKGSFLHMLMEHGLKLGVGIEPSFHGNLCFYQDGWDTAVKQPIQLDAEIGTLVGDGKFENLMCYLFGRKTMKFDLVMTFEVFEHIPRPMHCSMLNFLASMVKKWVVSSIARPGQGGIKHISEREKQDWINEWESRGLTFRRDLTEKVTEFALPTFAKNNTVILEAQGEVKQINCRL